MQNQKHLIFAHNGILQKMKYSYCLLIFAVEIGKAIKP